MNKFYKKISDGLLVIVISICIFSQSIAAPVFAAEKGEETDSETRKYEILIAHGGGTVDGIRSTSSVDALEKAVQNGFKMIELDMVFTKDGELVMLHDWDRTTVNYLKEKLKSALTLRDFENRRIAGKFKPLTMNKLAEFLKKHEDVKIVSDTKENNIKVLSYIKKKYPQTIKQIIPQIYDYDEYESVKILGYKDIIFTLYALGSVDAQKVADFAKEKNLYAVTVPAKFYTPNVPETLSKQGIKVYTHPIETFEDAQNELNRGVIGVYTSDLLPEEFNGQGREYYLLQSDINGNLVRLRDAEINADWITSVRIHGDLSQKILRYKLDKENLDVGLKKAKNSLSEMHQLSIEIWDTSKRPMQLYHTMEYALTKNNDKLCILDKKFVYRLYDLKEIPDFKNVIDENSEEAKILEKSFIAKSGYSYYYFQGKGKNFYSGKDLLTVETGKKGSVMIPLAETGKLLGIDNFVFGAGQYIYINENQDKYLSELYTGYMQKNGMSSVLYEPMTLSKSKVMAGGEVFKKVLGCDFIESKSVIIILPQDVKVTDLQKKKMLEMADKLFLNFDA